MPTKRYRLFECSITISALVNIIRIFLVFIISTFKRLVFLWNCFGFSLAQFDRLDPIRPWNLLIRLDDMKYRLNRLTWCCLLQNRFGPWNPFKSWLIFGAKLRRHLTVDGRCWIQDFLVNGWRWGRCSSWGRRWTDQLWQLLDVATQQLCLMEFSTVALLWWDRNIGEFLGRKFIHQ